MGRTSKETVEKILHLKNEGLTHKQISEKTGIKTSTVGDIVRRDRLNGSKKIRYHAHCYTCEYSIYGSTATSRGGIPNVVGCLMHCDTPKTCRKWLDDKNTADRVKAGLRGKYKARRENEEKAIYKQERDQPSTVPDVGGTKSSISHESSEQGT